MYPLLKCTSIENVNVYIHTDSCEGHSFKLVAYNEIATLLLTYAVYQSYVLLVTNRLCVSEGTILIIVYCARIHSSCDLQEVMAIQTRLPGLDTEG